MNSYDVTVIGGGPAGLSAALSAHRGGAATLLLEREARLGGILKQCIHDGFGLVRFGEKLSGPEYAERFIDEFTRAGIESRTLTFVTRIERDGEGFDISAVSRRGVERFFTKTIVLSTGCRERTAKQVFIHGTRPSGIFTAGTAQHFTNLMGLLPTKKCVVLGSGDIGLIMARRLTLEGAKVVGVYEAKPTPSGLTRNIHQCLDDFDIPLYLSHTVTRVFGDERLTAVEICEVDDKMRPVEGTQRVVECDGLILSVGLIPENELASSLGVRIDPRTRGPVCDNTLMSETDGVFSCGNALHVNDLVDYVSESGETAGAAAAAYRGASRSLIDIETGEGLAYFVPQRLELNGDRRAVAYFRSREILGACVLEIRVDGKVKYEKKYPFMRPPEMARLELDFSAFGLDAGSRVSVSLREV